MPISSTSSGGLFLSGQRITNGLIYIDVDLAVHGIDLKSMYIDIILEVKLFLLFKKGEKYVFCDEINL